MQKEKITDASGTKPSIIIAGHSGAYRVMSYILLYSQYDCKSIILFDALYAQTEKFAMYLQTHPSTKF
ncbi:hypothetical protein ABTL67_20085, partial [Acinetobacter baumannii]